MNCEMCGKETKLYKSIIEGIAMNVCENCAKFGRIVEKAEEAKKSVEKKAEEPEEPEIVETIVDDYAEIVKKAREKTGLKQEDVAKKLNEKESVIHKTENGHFKPSIALAKKLESFFHITLVEEITIEHKKSNSESSEEGLTIGDMIKFKK